MPVTLVVAIVAAVVLVAIFAVRTELRNAKRRAELLATRSFRPLEKPAPELAEPLLQLYRRGRTRGRHLQLWRVFHRDHPGGGMFVFGVLSPGTKSSRVVTSSVGVVRRGAGLPPFEIYAVGEEAGPMARFVLPILTGPLAQGQVVRLEGVPEFARRFTVLCPEESAHEAVRAFLTPARREALLRFQFFTLLAEGDAFALHANTLSGPHRGDEVGALGPLIDEAAEVARELEALPGSGELAHW